MRIVLETDQSRNEIHGSMDFGNGQTPLGPVDVTKYAETLVKNNNVDMGLLQPAVRWISQDKRMVVFERPPTIKRMEWISASREDIWQEGDGLFFKTRSHMLPCPWTVYLVCFDVRFEPLMVKVFFRNEQLTSLNDPVFLPPLLNLYNSAMLCNPIYGKYEDKKPSLANGINDAYNMVWNSGWNLDLKDAISLASYQSKPFSFKDDIYGMLNMFTKWSEASLDDALEWNWPWPSLSQNASCCEDLRLRTVIDYTRDEDIVSDYSVVRSFMVELVNTFSM